MNELKQHLEDSITKISVWVAKANKASTPAADKAKLIAKAIGAVEILLPISSMFDDDPQIAGMLERLTERAKEL